MASFLASRIRLLRWMTHYYRPEHTVTIDTANGRLSVSSSDWLIGKILFTRREFEIDFIRDSITFLAAHGYLKEGPRGTVVDVGANIGMITTAMLREGYFDRAIAFEPSPGNFELLEENIEQNGLSERAATFEIALTSSDGEAEFEIAEDNSGDSRVRVLDDDGQMNEGQRKTLNVKARRFDSFLAQNPQYVDEIDLVWMDVQGHEGHFFAGAREFFSSHSVSVVSEFWGYGIERSGMSRGDYCSVVSALFSKFHIYENGQFAENSTEDLGSLFEKYSKPRQGTNIILTK